MLTIKTLFLGREMRRDERARFLIALYSVLALTLVLSLASSAEAQRLRVAPVEQVISAEQQVINARQGDRQAIYESRLSAFESLKLDTRLSVLESAVESLTWSARTNYVVAATLLLNLIATIYQMRANRDHRRSGG